MKNSIRFWGVRGSVATPGGATVGVGGNTSCVEVRIGEETIIIDAGTGLRALGAKVGMQPLEATLLLSHLHWDHIQGLPFFAPLFAAGTRLRIVGPRGTAEALEARMLRPAFPISMAAFAGFVTIGEVSPGTRIAVGGLSVRTAPLRHPGGGIGYRVEGDGCSFVYVCDTEPPAQGIDEEVLDLALGADVLVHDAQYLPEEYPSRVGFGHGTFEVAAAMAERARVDRLVLTHHNPGRDDAAVEEIERRAREIFPRATAAREGMVLPIGFHRSDFEVSGGRVRAILGDPPVAA